MNKIVIISLMVISVKIQTLENQNMGLLSDIHKPKTVISGTDINWTVYDSKGNVYEWTMPVATYESAVIDSNAQSYLASKASGVVDSDSFWSTIKSMFKQEVTEIVGDGLGLEVKTVSLRLDNGLVLVRPDYTTFVKPSFSNIIDGVYDNSKDDSDFIYEVWYIVSQFTVYDKDVNEQSQGRLPLETLTRTGGDCEDLAILIASMLKSSSHTEDWDISLVYMDIDNPKNFKNSNHVIVYVNDGQYYYNIEATLPEPDFGYWPYEVDGFYFPV